MILIAEDDPDDQFLIQTVANEVCPQGTQIHFVVDGIELLGFLQEKVTGPDRPELILIDLNLPRKDGREALKEIKSNPELAKIPTVIFTTSSRDEDVDYCRRLSVDGYYRKPGPIAELREIFRRLCADFLTQR
jgi:CheY-like chemotaxis protein